MKILLPPSETKRSGGTGSPLRLDEWELTSLRVQRDEVVSALVALAADQDASRRVLKLSERQLGEIAHNAALRTSQTMAAVDRYTGVLFDALDAASLSTVERRWLDAHVWIHSAPFGPVGALDAIPAYRLGAAASVPGLLPLKRYWAASVTEAIAESAPDFVLDLRSEAYVALGPVPQAVSAVYVRVVTDDSGGTRALNHFNKKAKGELVRLLAQERPQVRSLKALLRWAHSSGTTLRETSTEGIIELVVCGTPQ